MVSAPWATKLMADLGADVVKVESPEGERARSRGPFPSNVAGSQSHNASGLYLALNTNKRNIVVDTPNSTVLNRLTAESDIVVTNLRPHQLAKFGIDLQTLHHERPDLVICSITPFGLTGPYADYAAEEITVANAGGWAYVTPGASSEVDQPPLKVFGHQTDFHVGAAAATVALASCRRALTDGVGDFVDFSSMAHTAGMLEGALIMASYMDENPSRLGSRVLNPWRTFECTDGLIFLVTIEEDQWTRLVETMGTPEWTQTGLFDTIELRLENEDLLVLYIEEWTRQFSVDDLWHLGQANRVCFAPVSTMATVSKQQHLLERGFFASVDHPVAGTLEHLGPLFLASNNSWGPLLPAPSLETDSVDEVAFGPGREREKKGVTPKLKRPLDGVRVVDFSWVWAGPYCALHLAFLGAEVFKIESSKRPGLGRRLPLHAVGVEPTLNTCSYFNQWDQAKLSVELHLDSPEAIELVKQLVVESDVVIENFATGVMEKFGLGYSELRQLNPSIVMASIAGYGSVGPLANYMGYGPTTGPLSGLSSLTGYSGGPPRELGVAVGDPASGIATAFAICAALLDRDATGTGCYIDTSLWEATTSTAVEGWMQYAMNQDTPERDGNHDPIMSPHNCYRAAPDSASNDDDSDDQSTDPGQWISIACATDEQWQALAGVVDPALQVDQRFVSPTDRKRNETTLDSIIAHWCASQDRWEATRCLQAVGVPAFPSLSPQDVLHDEHLWSRGFFERLDHAEVGRRVHTGMAWRSSRTPNGVPMPAPLMGEHTNGVLSDVLGLSVSEIEALRSTGVVGG